MLSNQLFCFIILFLFFWGELRPSIVRKWKIVIKERKKERKKEREQKKKRKRKRCPVGVFLQRIKLIHSHFPCHLFPTTSENSYPNSHNPPLPLTQTTPIPLKTPLPSSKSSKSYPNYTTQSSRHPYSHLQQTLVHHVHSNS